MSSGLSGSCQTALMLSDDYNGKVYVVNNQRISVTQKQSVLDAMKMAENGISGNRIKNHLEKTKFDSSIYITLETLKYLKKGGRITPAAATMASLLKIKPILQIQGEKLDSFSKARTKKSAKTLQVPPQHTKQLNPGRSPWPVWLLYLSSGIWSARLKF